LKKKEKIRKKYLFSKEK